VAVGRVLHSFGARAHGWAVSCVVGVIAVVGVSHDSQALEHATLRLAFVVALALLVAGYVQGRDTARKGAGMSGC